MGNLRLLHLDIRPVFLDDGGDDDITMLQGDPFVLPASKVATFSEDWARDFKIAQEQHEKASATEPIIEE